MRGLQLKALCLGFIVVILLSSGCASTKITKRVEGLEMQVAQLRQVMNQKDGEIQKLQDLLDDREMQLQNIESSYQELRDEFNKYKTGLKSSVEEKEEEVLK